MHGNLVTSIKDTRKSLISGLLVNYKIGWNPKFWRNEFKDYLFSLLFMLSEQCVRKSDSASYSYHRNVALTLPLRYWVISDSRKMYNLLTLVDRVDFICKRKRKSILIMKNEKKSLLCLRATYLYRKIILSDPVERRSVSRHSTQASDSRWVVSSTRRWRIFIRYQ